MLQQSQPDDYVIATGETHSVRELLTVAFATVGINDWKRYIEIDPRLVRPNEVDLLLGDPRKAEQKLSWQAKTKFADLVRLMVTADLEQLKKNSLYEAVTNE
jgi:GDPmannose 4,6-dehydratase